MKRLFLLLLMLVVFFAAQAVSATGFYAATNQLGYQGTIWNITDGTAPQATTTPRNANIYTVVDVPGSSNYNILASNWSEHSLSNQNDSFFQLYEAGNPSVISAIGGWDSSLTTFSMSVSGANAPYPWSRFWQPDNGVAWGVNFTEYTYALTATFNSPAVLGSDGFYVNSVNPNSIAGNFSGEFIVTQDVNKNPINGDLYGFDIDFSSAMFAGLDNLDAYGNQTAIYNDFGGAAAPVPEPATMLLLATGLGGLGVFRKRAKK